MRYLFFFFLSCLLFSCDDEISVTPREDSMSNYFPVDANRQWIYDTSITFGANTETSVDTTFISGTTQIDGERYSIWEDVSNVVVLTQKANIQTDDNSDIWMKPALEIFDFNEDIPLQKQLFVQPSTTSGQLQRQEIEQTLSAISIDTLDISAEILPTVFLSIETSVANTYPILELNGDSYEDVYETVATYTLGVNIDINATYNGLPIALTHEFIPVQEFGVQTYYFANEIGVARVEHDFEIADVNTTLSIPVVGDINLEDLGFSVEELLGETDFSGVAELIQ